jgi:hypothetical protein
VTTGSAASTATTRSGDGDDIVNTTDTVQGNDLADGGQAAADSCRTDPGDQTVRCP